MPDHNYFSNLIWQIADLLRGPYRPPQYERVMLPMTVLRRFDCVLAPTKAKVLADRLYVRCGNLTSSAGIVSGIDMALAVIEPVRPAPAGTAGSSPRPRHS